MEHDVKTKTSQVWLEALSSVSKDGQNVSPRGFATHELMGVQTKIPMAHPVMAVLDRELGYRFMAAEAAWILSGDNRVATIAPYSKVISRFSDDGIFFFGAYGTKLKDQLPYVIDKLLKSEDTRHALVNIWREQPRETKDVPCTVSLQWLIRRNFDGTPVLHCFDTMRSSDIWLGWPYDVFNMSVISLYLALCLKQLAPEKYGNVVLGDLTLTAASQHLYEKDFPKAGAIINSRASIMQCMAYDANMFASPQHLIDWLWGVANVEDSATALQLLCGKVDRETN